ncbi:MAG TPA: cardiolipin synthase [Pyrinomonadaceae bacterium]|nr:cardiolipin synthase [Pyrinomonadaceae bacterium]
MDSTAFLVIAVIAIAVLAFLLFLALFEPGLAYKISAPDTEPPESEDFLCVLEAITDSKIHRQGRVEVLTNGDIFYEEELKAISEARHSVNIEAYIFQKGELTKRFVDALTERARAGVKVRMVIDAIGSFATWESYFKDLRAAGGRISWYHPLRFFTLSRFNNRTHREIIVVDGRVGFVGGAGFADHWYKNHKKMPRWRDTMVRVEGETVTSIQAGFVENWLEASGEILTGKEYFPPTEIKDRMDALVVDSSPTAGGSTRARILFQTLLASARETIHITTPYFLPDRSVRRELLCAIRERGVQIKIIVPGKHSDHMLTRSSSRRLFGELLKAGAKIYEYEKSMIHAKTMVLDDLWSVVGSTNFDNRSFGLNDEINLAARDTALAARLMEDFAKDLAESREVSYEEWQRRSIFERMHEWLGQVLERQQ